MDDDGGGNVTQQSRMHSARIGHSNHFFFDLILQLSSCVSKTGALIWSENRRELPKQALPGKFRMWIVVYYVLCKQVR